MTSLITCDAFDCHALTEVPKGKERDVATLAALGWKLAGPDQVTGGGHLCPKHVDAKPENCL